VARKKRKDAGFSFDRIADHEAAPPPKAGESTSGTAPAGAGVKIQGFGASPADVALLSAIATATGQSRGAILAAGVRLYFDSLDKDTRKRIETVAGVIRER